MIKKLEDFLFNKFAGKIIARGAVTLAGLISAKLAALAGIHVDPLELQAALIAAAHAAFEWIKAKRNKSEQPAA